MKVRGVCSFPGCGRPHEAHGLCKQHDKQRARGFVLKPLGVMRPRRQLIPHPEIPGALMVPLSKGLFAIIDAADGVVVSGHNWSALVRRPTCYATVTVRRGERQKSVSLHVFLWKHWGLPSTELLDHINMNGLDCRRGNLRAASTSQNMANRRVRADSRSGVKGVRISGAGRWEARIRRTRLGSFASPQEASAAYEAAARKVFGEFARAA